MKNFVIMYREREGSSPMVATLGNHPDVHLPLFEQLDHYVAKDFADNFTIATVLENILRGEGLEHGGQVMAKPLNSQAREATSIGFKWRFWGEPRPIQEALARNGVLVMHLFRRNLIELAASLYFTSTVIPQVEKERGMDIGGGGHLQFSLTRMSKEEREKRLSLLHSVTFQMPVDKVRETSEKIVKEKTDKYLRYLDGLSAMGVEIRSILYEDFCSDKRSFFADIYTALGVDAGRQPELDSHFTKVGGENFLSQLENLAEIEADPSVRAVLREYDELIFDRHIYLGRAAIDRIR